MEEKRNLYFQHSDGTYSILAENCTKFEAGLKMAAFINKHNFKSYYTRCWETPKGAMYFDFGSHVQYFIWANEDALDNYKKKD